MKRIDSINARPDVNGVGKTGFHDNADLSGQDATYVTPDWLNHIQEELCNLLEKNGIELDGELRDQLYQLLATQDDLLALATAVQNLVDTKYDKTGGTISGNASIDGNLSAKILRITGAGDYEKLEILTQAAWTGFRMLMPDGNTSQDLALFSFEGSVLAENLFLGGNGANIGDYSGSRALNTIYSNSSKRTKWVNIGSDRHTGDTYLTAYVSLNPNTFIGVIVAAARINSNVTPGGCNISFPVPAGAQFRVEGTGITHWAEMF